MHCLPDSSVMQTVEGGIGIHSRCLHSKESVIESFEKATTRQTMRFSFKKGYELSYHNKEHTATASVAHGSKIPCSSSIVLCLPLFFWHYSWKRGLLCT